MQEFGIKEINQNWKEYLHHTDSYILKENYENNFPNPFDLSFINDFETRMTESILSLPRVAEIRGAKSIVEYFSNKSDYFISFATGSLLNPALVKLEQAGIQHDVEIVVGSNKVYEREGIVKEAIHRVRQFYGVKTFTNIISVGDGIWDLRTAQNLGLYFIEIGMKNYADFERENIKFHIRDWNEFDIRHLEKQLK